MNLYKIIRCNSLVMPDLIFHYSCKAIQLIGNNYLGLFFFSWRFCLNFFQIELITSLNSTEHKWTCLLIFMLVFFQILTFLSQFVIKYPSIMFSSDHILHHFNPISSSPWPIFLKCGHQFLEYDPFFCKAFLHHLGVEEVETNFQSFHWYLILN